MGKPTGRVALVEGGALGPAAPGAATTTQGISWLGGITAAFVEASTFDTETLTVQVKSPNGTWMDTTVALTANGFSIVDLPPGLYRVSISGGGGDAENLYAYLVGVPE